MAGSIKQQEFGQHQVFFVEGYLDKELAMALLDQYKAQKQKGLCYFILDFSKTTLINSFALSYLLDMVSDCIGEDELSFYFCAIPENCYYGMSAVGLMNCITEFDSFEQAKAELIIES